MIDGQGCGGVWKDSQKSHMTCEDVLQREVLYIISLQKAQK